MARYEAEIATVRFAAKLTQKIDTVKPAGAKVTAATCTANFDPGRWSTLRVEGLLGDNSPFTQVWETQTINNFSVYGKPFNQWPTRQVA